jgi:hypothetical protein
MKKFTELKEGMGHMKESLLDKVTLSPESIAAKHGVSLEHIETQLKQGIKIEQEHTSHLDIAREIALDHLGEDPDYYTKLKRVEEAHDPYTDSTGEVGHQMRDKVLKKQPTHKQKLGVLLQWHKTNTIKTHELHRHLQDLYGANHLHEALISLEESNVGDYVTIHYGAHSHEPHRVIKTTPEGHATIMPSRARGRQNRYPGGELKVKQLELHPYPHKIEELHDEPDRPGVGIGSSNREGMNMTESYPHQRILRQVLKEALPQRPEDQAPQEGQPPVSKTAQTVKDVVKKDKVTKDNKDSSNGKVTFGKTKDSFEPDPVLTPVLSIANMPGGTVR